MDVDEYAAARYGRLVEHAISLGCPEDEAGACVDQVLLAQRKAIRKAEDPDPLVHEALERALSGTPERHRPKGPLLALGLVAVVAAAAGALTYEPSTAPMPSLFGLDGPAAQRVLLHRGYEVDLRPSEACEPPGLVVATDPVPGEPVDDGGTVTVRTAVPPTGRCTVDEAALADAWQFVRFALGGDPPEFAETVYVVVDRSEPATLTHDQAGDRRRWGGTFDLLDRIAHQPAPTETGMPVLRTAATVPPDSYCTVPRPLTAGSRRALRIQLDPRGPRDDHGCPLTVDLYREGRVIDSVVFYTPKALASQ